MQMRVYKKRGDLALGRVEYVSEPTNIVPYGVSENRAQRISNQQFKVKALRIYKDSFTDDYTAEIDCEVFAYKDIKDEMKQFNEEFLPRDRSHDNVLRYKFKKGTLIAFLHVFHDRFYFDAVTHDDLQRSLNITLPLTLQDGLVLVHQGCHETAFNHRQEMGQRTCHVLGRRSRKLGNTEWAIKFYLHDSKLDDFNFGWSYYAALYLLSAALPKNPAIYSNIFLQMDFDEAFTLMQKHTDGALWYLGAVCDALYLDKTKAKQCFAAIPKSSAFYQAANQKLMEYEENEKDQSRDPLAHAEQVFRFGLLAAKPENQRLIDKRFNEMCGLQDDGFEGIKGDPDTLVTVSKRMMELTKRLGEMECENKRLKEDGPRFK